jgi:hypothetical protein
MDDHYICIRYHLGKIVIRLESNRGQFGIEAAIGLEPSLTMISQEILQTPGILRLISHDLVSTVDKIA